MIIYGSTLSPFVRKVVMAAGEKGLEFEVRSTGLPNPTDDFLAISPFAKMPAIRDGGFTLADSSAIVHYLDAKYPNPKLIPAEAEARGRAIWFDEFADTVLVACGVKMFFNRIIAPRFLGFDGDLKVAATAERDELPPILDYLERIVPDAGGYLVGDGLTIADIAVAMPFANLRHSATVDERRFSRTLAYADSILARPSVAPWFAKECELLAQKPA